MLGGSFGRSFFDDMEKDPFFKIPQHTRRQQDMFDNMLGFGQTDRHHGQLNQTETNEKRAVAPFSMFDEDFGFENMFGRMRNMMSSMEKQFTAARNNQDTNCFSQSSIMTYSKDGERPPKFYKAAISTRTAPGGIKEVKKAEHDSERGVQKMAIGHHIRDRGHVRERLHNTKTGYKNEDQNFINLNESEAEQFHREWDEKTRQYTRVLEDRKPDRRTRHLRQHGLPDPGRLEQRRQHQQLALPDPEQMERHRMDDHLHDERRRERNSHRERH